MKVELDDTVRKVVCDGTFTVLRGDVDSKLTIRTRGGEAFEVTMLRNGRCLVALLEAEISFSPPGQVINYIGSNTHIEGSVLQRRGDFHEPINLTEGLSGELPSQFQIAIPAGRDVSVRAL